MISRLVAYFALLAAALVGGCASQQVLNSLSSDEGFQRAENVPYDAATGLTLDVYRPTGPGPAPVVVFFYGGRWSSGDKSEYKFVGQALASRGFVAVVPNLREYPTVRFPEFVNDGARAVRWTRDNIANYGGNPQTLFIMGHSSGAHVAAMLALNGEYLKKAGMQRSDLKGMIGLAGPYDFLPITAPDLRDIFGPPEKFQYSQPIFFVDGKNPPLLLVHGRNDDVIFADNTLNLARAVSKAGGAVETVLYDNLSHSMIIGSLASYLRGRADVLDQIEDFIKRTIAAPPRAAEPEIRGTPLDVANPPAGGGVAAQPLEFGAQPPAQALDVSPLQIEPDPVPLAAPGVGSDGVSPYGTGGVQQSPEVMPTAPPGATPLTPIPLPGSQQVPEAWSAAPQPTPQMPEGYPTTVNGAPVVAPTPFPTPAANLPLTVPPLPPGQ
ncbi:alpha/beta hydrolase [Sinimarinibacterium sp. CAU 1509]|uniref:alpha/beta hydrolase n=1 Tax=Sinimarinibacterium sp. CAU 1509 TaxID=2562283 RepID=UPI0010ACCF31|nr:alpha/beta hydrolase [Sinimarinibacterium sp. CAU 1509]TJY56746.1 alpha/beta hydrolase [Sinimarinibacterium sp. CAU 1509]